MFITDSSKVDELFERAVSLPSIVTFSLHHVVHTLFAKIRPLLLENSLIVSFLFFN